MNINQLITPLSLRLSIGSGFIYFWVRNPRRYLFTTFSNSLSMRFGLGLLADEEKTLCEPI